MARDKQIFVRVDEDVYDWVAEQAAAAGMSHGGAAAKILAEAKRYGWVIEPGRVVVHKDGDPANNDPENLEIRETQ